MTNFSSGNKGTKTNTTSATTSTTRHNSNSKKSNIIHCSQINNSNNSNKNSNSIINVNDQTTEPTTTTRDHAEDDTLDSSIVDTTNNEPVTIDCNCPVPTRFETEMRETRNQLEVVVHDALMAGTQASLEDWTKLRDVLIKFGQRCRCVHFVWDNTKQQPQPQLRHEERPQIVVSMDKPISINFEALLHEILGLLNNMTDRMLVGKRIDEDDWIRLIPLAISLGDWCASMVVFESEHDDDNNEQSQYHAGDEEEAFQQEGEEAFMTIVLNEHQEAFDNETIQQQQQQQPTRIDTQTIQLHYSETQQQQESSTSKS
eukprot:CAMPEP_0118682682 /NCGR_PEP_ID=MMETSP0800-20121206/5614_1 /TAXON_ID=210618 ORGANISM="Striatella unipunctata, Strain CCMP2910" /NCGR_SAMPLE_ID=MMETSP0800 /ASSEMBLY_ACC=CAM_ASM_000638 /LENGTH=314 /DNA_ID=CAMNT_0006579085 /DNA_START=662 /DNA_END=1606 /DNA_ORIENTATION=-